MKLRLNDGAMFVNERGDWIKIEGGCRDTVSYNSSRAIQWAGGACTCSRKKMRKMLERGGYRRKTE